MFIRRKGFLSFTCTDHYVKIKNKSLKDNTERNGLQTSCGDFGLLALTKKMNDLYRINGKQLKLQTFFKVLSYGYHLKHPGTVFH